MTYTITTVVTLLSQDVITGNGFGHLLEADSSVDGIAAANKMITELSPKDSERLQGLLYIAAQEVLGENAEYFTAKHSDNPEKVIQTAVNARHLQIQTAEEKRLPMLWAQNDARLTDLHRFWSRDSYSSTLSDVIPQTGRVQSLQIGRGNKYFLEISRTIAVPAPKLRSVERVPCRKRVSPFHPNKPTVIPDDNSINKKSGASKIKPPTLQPYRVDFTTTPPVQGAIPVILRDLSSLPVVAATESSITIKISLNGMDTPVTLETGTSAEPLLTFHHLNLCPKTMQLNDHKATAPNQNDDTRFAPKYAVIEALSNLWILEHEAQTVLIISGPTDISISKPLPKDIIKIFLEPDGKCPYSAHTYRVFILNPAQHLFQKPPGAAIQEKFMKAAAKTMGKLARNLDSLRNLANWRPTWSRLRSEPEAANGPS